MVTPTPGSPQVKPGCPDSEIVRAAVDTHYEQVYESCMADYAKRAGYESYIERGAHYKLLHEYGDGIEDALQALCALAAGKPWPADKP